MSALSAWLGAARPKTLSAAIVPVWLGCVLAYGLEGECDLWLAVCTLMGAVWIQIATNLFNDAIDADKGADTEKRLGPQRVTASGLLSRRAVYAAAVVCLLVAALFGWSLVVVRGWVMLAIGLPSLYLCYGYTGGPFPLAYRGMGELFVLLFFGLIAVTGTVFVQLGAWRWEALLLGGQLGALSAVLISINNLRDCGEDATTGKGTLAVRWGVRSARGVLLLELVLPMLLGVVWFVVKGWSIVAFLPMLYVVFALPIGAGVLRREPSGMYNTYLAMGGVQLLAFGAFYTVAMFLQMVQ